MNDKSGEGGKNSYDVLAVFQVGNWWQTGDEILI